MFKLKKLMPLVVMFVCLLVIPVFAATIATVGNYNSSGDYDIVVDSDHGVTFNGGVYAKYELATTNDTITAVESGKTFIVEGVCSTSSTTTFNLPDADVGLEFTFVIGAGHTICNSTSDSPDININPQDTDYIYFTNSNAENTFAVGDSLNSTGTTADSVRLICGKDLYWYATDVRGTWTDLD